MKSVEFTQVKLKKIITENMAILALFFFGITVIFFGLSTHSFTLDEIFSLFVSRDWSEMTKILWNEEANMWLYYLILHFWQTLGTNELAVRSLSASFAIGAIPLTYAIAKHLFDKKLALVAVLLMIFNIFYIISAQFARSYSLLLFLTLASTYFFLHFGKSRSHKVLYIISSALAIYAHFYAGLVVLSQVLMAIFTKKMKKYFWAFVSIGIFLTPILFSPSIQSHQIDWLEKPTITNLVGTFFVLAGDFPFLFIIYGLIFIFVTPHVVKNLSKFRYQFLVTWLITPVATALMFSFFVKPIYLSVYFLISLPPFVILAADGMNTISKRKLKDILIVMVVILSILRLSLWWSQNTRYKWVFSNNDEDWRLAAKFVSENAQENDAIIFYGYYNRMPYEFYSDSNRLVYSQDTPQIIEISPSPYSLGGGSELPPPDYDLLAKLDFERVWLLLRDGDRGLLRRDEQLAEIKAVLQQKYRQESNHDFPGLKLALYVYKS